MEPLEDVTACPSGNVTNIDDVIAMVQVARDALAPCSQPNTRDSGRDGLSTGVRQRQCNTRPSRRCSSTRVTGCVVARRCRGRGAWLGAPAAHSSAADRSPNPEAPGAQPPMAPRNTTTGPFGSARKRQASYHAGGDGSGADGGYKPSGGAAAAAGPKPAATSSTGEHGARAEAPVEAGLGLEAGRQRAPKQPEAAYGSIAAQTALHALPGAACAPGTATAKAPEAQPRQGKHKLDRAGGGIVGEGWKRVSGTADAPGQAIAPHRHTATPHSRGRAASHLQEGDQRPRMSTRGSRRENANGVQQSNGRATV